MIILLLRGFAGAGKDTFGKCFVDKFGFTRFAFADYLKKMVSEKYNIDKSILHSQIGKMQIEPVSNKTWRAILLQEARECRAKDPDIFANMCASDIQLSFCKNIIITDWRFPNEYKIIVEKFPNAICKTIEIKRIGQKISMVNDISEYLLKDIEPDYIIYNDGVEDLLPKAISLYEKIIIENK
jgi:adenylate kinase family enzyme